MESTSIPFWTWKRKRQAAKVEKTKATMKVNSSYILYCISDTVDTKDLEDFLDDGVPQQSNTVGHSLLQEPEDEDRWDELIEKYVHAPRNSNAELQSGVGNEDDFVSREDDWKLWELNVPVSNYMQTCWLKIDHSPKVGDENAVVFRLCHRALTFDKTKTKDIRSVFAAPGVRGCVYVEGRVKYAVEALCEGMARVHVAESGWIDTPEGIRLLQRSGNAFYPKVGMWVRMRTRRYHNDLAYIMAVHNLMVDLVLLPRLNYTSSKNKRKCSERPEQGRLKVRLADGLQPNSVRGNFSEDGELLYGYRWHGMMFDISRYLLL